MTAFRREAIRHDRELCRRYGLGDFWAPAPQPHQCVHEREHEKLSFDELLVGAVRASET